MTPQQANLAPCPFCGGPARHLERNPGFYDERAICDPCNYSLSPGAWNRRAPAPTEPAVDRDARNAQRAIADIRRFVNESSDKNLGMWIDDDIDTLTNYLATPASPAVPGKPRFKDHDIRQLVNDLRAIAIEFHAGPQVAQAPAPTAPMRLICQLASLKSRTPEAVGLLVDEAKKIMAQPTSAEGKGSERLDPGQVQSVRDRIANQAWSVDTDKGATK